LLADNIAKIYQQNNYKIPVLEYSTNNDTFVQQVVYFLYPYHQINTMNIIVTFVINKLSGETVRYVKRVYID